MDLKCFILMFHKLFKTSSILGIFEFSMARLYLVPLVHDAYKLAFFIFTEAPVIRPLLHLIVSKP